MNEFTKICLRIIAVLAILGVVLAGIGLILGGQNQMGEALPGLEEVSGRIREHRTKRSSTDEEQHETNIIKEGVYQTPTALHKIELDISYGEVKLVRSENEMTVVSADQVGKALSCYEENGELYIELNKKITPMKGVDTPCIEIALPDRELDSLDIDLGAGTFNAEEIRAGEISLDIGAGEAVIRKMQAGDTADLDVGAGRIEIGSFTGKRLEGDCGAGEMDICLNGSRKSYNYTIDCGVGEVKLGNESFSGLGSSKMLDSGADQDVELDCSMGSICITFSE